MFAADVSREKMNIILSKNAIITEFENQCTFHHLNNGEFQRTLGTNVHSCYRDEMKESSLSILNK